MLFFNLKKLTKVLSLKIIFQIYFLYLGLIFLTFLEVIGLGTIPLILSQIIEPNLINNYLNFDLDNFIFKYFNFENSVVFLSIFLLIIFAVKTIYILFINFYELSILKKIRNTLSVDLMKAYVSRPYVFFLTQNSSVLAKNVLKEVDYSINYISSLFLILKEIQLIFVVLIFLLFIEPLVTIYGFAFIGIVSVLFYKLTDKKLKIVAVNRIKALEDLYRVSFEIFGAIKEIKIYKKFNFFIKKFQIAKFEFEKNILVSDYIKKLPRVFFEFFSVVFIVFLILVSYFNDKNLIALIPFLSLIVVTIIRLMPSFSSLASSFTHLRVYKNSFEEVVNEIFKLKADQIKDSKEVLKANYETNKIEKNIISLKNISFNYPSANKGSRSINNINLEIEKGSMIGFLGKSGSGKSTLINMILKLIEPDNGKVIFSSDPKKKEYPAISFVPQDIYLIDDTIRKNIAFGVDDNLIEDKKIIECLKDTEMWDYTKKHDAGLNLVVGERGIRLSGGEKQRIGLARALYTSPEILILDEATSSLDNMTERKIVESIKKFKHKLTIIIVAHRLSTLEDCDKIFYVENGTIKDTGTLNDLMSKNKYLK
jgi:ABC-type multidrug transport system fused ATPase/permease subunit